MSQIRNNYFLNSVLKHPKLGRDLVEAWDAPVGSTKRMQAKSMISSLQKLHTNKYDGQGGPGFNTSTPYDAAPTTSSAFNDVKTIASAPAADVYKKSITVTKPAPTPKINSEQAQKKVAESGGYVPGYIDMAKEAASNVVGNTVQGVKDWRSSNVKLDERMKRAQHIIDYQNDVKATESANNVFGYTGTPRQVDPLKHKITKYELEALNSGKSMNAGDIADYASAKEEQEVREAALKNNPWVGQSTQSYSSAIETDQSKDSKVAGAKTTTATGTTGQTYGPPAPKNFTPEQTVGLTAAQNRVNAGTANDADKKAVTDAKSQGWNPSASSVSSTGTSNTSGTATGDTTGSTGAFDINKLAPSEQYLINEVAKGQGMSTDAWVALKMSQGGEEFVKLFPGSAGSLPSDEYLKQGEYGVLKAVQAEKHLDALNSEYLNRLRDVGYGGKNLKNDVTDYLRAHDTYVKDLNVRIEDLQNKMLTASDPDTKNRMQGEINTLNTFRARQQGRYIDMYNKAIEVSNENVQKYADLVDRTVKAVESEFQKRVAIDAPKAEKMKAILADAHTKAARASQNAQNAEYAAIMTYKAKADVFETLARTEKLQNEGLSNPVDLAKLKNSLWIIQDDKGKLKPGTDLGQAFEALMAGGADANSALYGITSALTNSVEDAKVNKSIGGVNSLKEQVLNTIYTHPELAASLASTVSRGIESTSKDYILENEEKVKNAIATLAGQKTGWMDFSRDKNAVNIADSSSIEKWKKENKEVDPTFLNMILDYFKNNVDGYKDNPWAVFSGSPEKLPSAMPVADLAAYLSDNLQKQIKGEIEYKASNNKQ